jgi:hypothetical protein
VERQNDPEYRQRFWLIVISNDMIGQGIAVKWVVKKGLVVFGVNEDRADQVGNAAKWIVSITTLAATSIGLDMIGLYLYLYPISNI